MRIQARPARPSARSGVRSILRPGLVGALAALGTVGAQAAPACPARDFPGFLAAFADDVAVQKAFVAVPLRSDTIDPEAEPEPKPVTTMLGADALRVQAGVDYRATPSLSVSPVLSLSATKFFAENAEDEHEYHEIDSPRSNVFVFAGVMGRFDIGPQRKAGGASVASR